MTAHFLFSEKKTRSFRFHFVTEGQDGEDGSSTSVEEKNECKENMTPPEINMVYTINENLSKDSIVLQLSKA